jgi:hypothetical protein
MCCTTVAQIGRTNCCTSQIDLRFCGPLLRTAAQTSEVNKNARKENFFSQRLSVGPAVIPFFFSILAMMAGRNLLERYDVIGEAL